MENILIHEYIIPFKGIGKKIIYHFSDSHLTEYDELSDAAETEKAKKQTEAWEGVRKGFCVAYGVPYGELEQQSPKTHFENLLQCAEGGDALAIAGDTLDYINGANLRLSDKLLGELEVPYIAVCGNHELPKDIPDGHIISAAKKPIQKLDLGDMVIVGIENAQRKISREQIDEFLAVIDEGKPTLIVMHVPIMTESNKALLEKSGVYFRLNYEGCPEENIEFIELIKRNADKIIAVLAGHLHYSNISEIASGVMQYVSSQGVTGNINRYVIGE